VDKTCNLRLLELSDLEFLERIENDTRLWKYSNTTEPFSNEVLKIYIQNAKQDIVDAGQQRFVIVDSDSNKLGLIDLFDYEPKHARAAVGVVIIEEYRGKGYAKEGLRLLEEKAIQKLNLHQLYAGVSIENTPSRTLFKAAGYIETAVKKDWSYYENQFHDEIIVQKFLNV
jgi:diamine N-acetyltransferase